MQKYEVSLTEDAENDIAELMAFYSELVDDESAMRFYDEAMRTVEKLRDFPHGNPMFKDDPSIHKTQMKNHKVAIVYLIDDNRFEVIAIRAYHQTQDPKKYLKSIKERIKKLRE
jgi:plasmid stabilization system protein ParE